MAMVFGGLRLRRLRFGGLLLELALSAWRVPRFEFERRVQPSGSDGSIKVCA